MESETTIVANKQSVECETQKIVNEQEITIVKDSVVSNEVDGNKETENPAEEKLQESEIIIKDITKETTSEEANEVENFEGKKILVESVEQENVHETLDDVKVNELQDRIIVEDKQNNIEEKEDLKDEQLPEPRIIEEQLEEINEIGKQPETESQENFIENQEIIAAKDVDEKQEVSLETLSINQEQDINEVALEEEILVHDQDALLEADIKIEQDPNLVEIEQEEKVQERIVVEEVHNIEVCVDDKEQEAMIEANHVAVCDDFSPEPVIIALIEKNQLADEPLSEQENQVESEEDQQNAEFLSELVEVPDTKQEEQQHELSLPSFVMQALDQIAVSEGFLPGYTFELQTGSNYGDGFVGILVRVIVSGKKSKNYKIVDAELKLICKVPSTNEAYRKQFGSMQLFEREVFMYNVMLPYFVKFQLDKGIKQHEGFFSFPKCYYASYDEEKEESVVILEDLLERSFQLPNKFKPVSYVELRKLMITLGRLHAISLAIKDQQPEQFENFKIKDKCDMFTTDKLQPMCEMLSDEAINALEEHEEFKREKIEKLKPNITKVMSYCFQHEEAEPYAVVNHGDCWINNIMFTEKLDTLQGDICMIDWQLSRYCSPVLDLVYFIFTCTDPDTRLQHYDNCIQIYHKALSTYLEQLGGDASRQFPLSALHNQLKKYGKYGVCTSILMTHMICAKNTDLPDMDTITDINNIKNYEAMHEKSGNYKTRMSGVIRDAVRLGYL